MVRKKKIETSQVPQTEGRVTELETQLKAEKDLRQRVAADFANYQRRIEEERAGLTRRANEDLLARLFPVFDNFYLAIRHNPVDLINKPQLNTDDRQKIASFIQGVSMIEKQLEDNLSEVGLSKVPTAGVVFDPNLHEAVSYEENKEIPADHIIGEVETGWQIDGVVIKPAKVRVSKG